MLVLETVDRRTRGLQVCAQTAEASVAMEAT
jgi:hypothetical protein